jgi:hypothetical protein
MATEMNEDLSRLSSAAKKLTDEELITRLKQCVARGRQWEARILVHMSEVDARKLYRDQGYSSMFEYARRALHMSEAEAGLRITTARFGRQYPQAFEMLARGEVHISAICVLASVPRAVRREVAERDGEQCAFVAPDGHRCEERARIEIDHHRVPAGRGGGATTDNLRLLCAAHNALEAERTYGPEYIRQRIAVARETSRSARAARSETSPADQHAGGSTPTPTAFPEAPTAELRRVSPLTGMENHPLGAVREPVAEDAEHSPPRAATSGSAPTAGAIVEPTLATHRPDGAFPPSGSAPTA